MTIEKEFLDFSAAVFHNWGFDNLSSQLVGILYLSPDAVSLEELAKKTGYSLASVSTKMKFLLHTAMVERIKKPGSKKVYYYGEKSLYKITLKKFERGMETEIIPAKQNIPPLIEKYKNRKLSDTDKKRLQIIQNYYDQIQEFEKLLLHMMKHLKDRK